MTVIGLAGLKGSGKDLAGAYLVERYGFVRKSFAEPLKESAAAALNVPVEWFETDKNDPNAKVIYDRGNETVVLTVREYLQRYGTEAHRDVFGKGFWTDQLISQLDGTNVVITDMRFLNETQAVKDAGGYTFLIDRPAVKGSGDTHASEELPPDDLIDYVVKNEGSIQDLYDALDEAVYLIRRRRIGLGEALV